MSARFHTEGSSHAAKARRRGALAAALCVTLFASNTLADDVDLMLRNQAGPGEKPSIVIIANRAIQDGALVLKREGATQKVPIGKVKKGERKELFIDQPDGRVHWEATIEIRYADAPKAPVELKFELDTVVAPPPKLSIRESDVEVAAGRLVVMLDRPCKSLKFDILTDDGNTIEGKQEFPSPPAGTPLPISWETKANVMRIELVAWDADGMHTKVMQLFPWSLEIPHTDIEFATGKSDIPKEEMPKVTSSVKDIQAALQKYGALVDITLFVAGHTDTQGDAEYNRKLSDARARSIAQAMKKAGVKIPIRYRGFGEDRLKVSTADNVDQKENRRAEYVLSVEEPLAGPWKGL